jgi:hypothetical protein
MEQSPSWESESCVTSKEIPRLYVTRRFITVFTAVYFEPDESSQHPLILFHKIHFNIILPSTPKISEWSLPFRFFKQNFCTYFSSPHTRYMLRQSHPA